MCFLSQDPCNEVREIFITKLYEGLRLFTLPLSYLSLFCMASDSSVPDTLPKSKVSRMYMYLYIKAITAMFFSWRKWCQLSLKCTESIISHWKERLTHLTHVRERKWPLPLLEQGTPPTIGAGGGHPYIPTIDCFIHQLLDKTAQLLPEYSLPYVVYLLSHNQSFSRTQSSRLDIFREYVHIHKQ